MAPTTVLISGANRGIGRGLIQRYLAQPNHLVIAANRDPTHSTSQSLEELPKGENTRLIVVKVDAASETDAFDAVKTLQQEHDVQHLDLVIANAGVSAVWPTVADLKVSQLQAHVEPNVYGMVHLYQATRPLLQKSSNPKFVPISSAAGSMGVQPPIPNAAYGPTKAMVNWLTLRIHAEDAWLNTFAIHPGLVETAPAIAAVDFFIAQGADFGVDAKSMYTPMDESTDGIVKVIAAFDKETQGGKLVSHAGDVIPW